MFRKRYFFIYIIIVLLIIIGAISATKQVVAIRNERSQMIEVCQQALSSASSSDRPGYTRYTCGDNVVYSYRQYKGIKSSPLSATVYFDDGTNDMWCDMQYNGSKWVVKGTAATIVGICP